MYWYWFSFAFIAVAGFLLVGIYMLYSAITGKGIPEPDPNSLWQIKAQFKLRGLVGFGFTIFGIVVLFNLIKILFEKQYFITKPVDLTACRW